MGPAASSDLRLAAQLTQPPDGSADTPASAPPAEKSGPHRLVEILGLVLATLAVALLLLLTVGPLVLPYRTLTVYSGSMEPTIHTGSVIVVLPVAAGDVKIGDIITFQRPVGRADLITHRVVEFENGPGGKSFITKGDANSASDGWRIPATGTGYRYWFGVPAVGYGLAWLQSPLGKFVFLLVPAAALGLILLYELWRPRRSARSGGRP